MTNPIRKRAKNLRYFHMDHWKRLWCAVCPDCGDTVDVNRYDVATRKTAKDALHRHRVKKHTQPGREVL